MVNNSEDKRKEHNIRFNDRGGKGKMRLETWITEAKECIEKVSKNPERYGALLFFFDNHKGEIRTYTYGDINLLNLLETLRKIRGIFYRVLKERFLDRR